MWDFIKFLGWQLTRPAIYKLLAASLMMYLGWKGRIAFREQIWAEWGQGPI